MIDLLETWDLIDEIMQRVAKSVIDIDPKEEYL